jgi:hypothetical protein
VWEYGYRREIPPEWKPLAELLKCRKLPEYARIMEAEERVGKYAKRRFPDEAEPPKMVDRRATAVVARLKHVPGKEEKKKPRFEVVFEK